MSNKLPARSLKFIFFVVMQTEHASSDQLAGFLINAKRKATLQLSHHFSPDIAVSFLCFCFFFSDAWVLSWASLWFIKNQTEVGL